MADPKRLVDRLGEGLEKDLLIVGSEERAPRAARERVLSHVLGVGATAAAASTLAAATGGGGGKSGSALVILVLKWLGIGALAGGVTALAGSAIVSARGTAERPAEPAPAARAASPSEWPIPPPAPRTVEPQRADAVEAEPSGKVEPRPPHGDVRIGTSSTTLEAESMRRIRSEARHDPAFAERLLRQHLARFPNGAHAAEASRLLEKLSAGNSSDPN